MISKNAVIFAGNVFGYMVYIELLKINKNQLIKRWIGYVEVEKTACLFAFPKCYMKNADQVMDVFGTLYVIYSEAFRVVRLRKRNSGHLFMCLNICVYYV